MAITQVGSGTSGSVNNGNSFSITKPTGVASGDVLILALTQNENTPSVSGFTLIREVTAAETTNTWSAHIYYKVAGGSEPASYTITHGGDTSAPFAGVLSAWRGVDTSAPINASTEQAGAGVSEAATGPTLTTTALSRRIVVRATRNTTDPAVTFSSGTSGWSELAEASGTSTGTVRYSVSQFARTADDNAASSQATPSITASQAETDNGWFHIALKTLSDPASGTISSTLGNVTSSFAGERAMPEGPIDSTLPGLVTDFTGTAAPPSGPMAATLGGVTSSWAATSDVGGPMAATLPLATSSGVGAVEPSGEIDATLPTLGFTGVGETRPFGEHVILVEPERRAFWITQDDMISIFASQIDKRWTPNESELAIVLPMLQVSITGETLPIGSFESELQPVQSESEGHSDLVADVDVTLPLAEASVAGEYGPIEGDVSSTLGAVTSDVAGTAGEFADAPAEEVGITATAYDATVRIKSNAEHVAVDAAN